MVFRSGYGRGSGSGRGNECLEGYGYRYVDDGMSEEIECEWSDVSEDWNGDDDSDYTEEFREVAERELDGKERHMVLSALVKKG